MLRPYLRLVAILGMCHMYVCSAWCWVLSNPDPPRGRWLPGLPLTWAAGGALSREPQGSRQPSQAGLLMSVATPALSFPHNLMALVLKSQKAGPQPSQEKTGQEKPEASSLLLLGCPGQGYAVLGEPLGTPRR